MRMTREGSAFLSCVTCFSDFYLFVVVENTVKRSTRAVNFLFEQLGSASAFHYSKSNRQVSLPREIHPFHPDSCHMTLHFKMQPHFSDRSMGASAFVVICRKWRLTNGALLLLGPSENPQQQK